MAKLTKAELEPIILAARRHAQLLDAVEKAYDGGDVIKTFELLKQLFNKEKNKGKEVIQ